MDASTYIEYRNWISELSEDHFNELILNYIKEYYDTKDAYICNGPYDGGNDLVLTIKGKEIKRNIQITIQKKDIEKKVIDDVSKAFQNVSKFSYLNKLDVYCSQHLSETKQQELKRTAFIDYNIELIIYDNYRLAELVTEYKSMLAVLRKVKEQAFPKESLNIDKNTKILFDCLSTNSNIGAIKINFIVSYILFHIYDNGPSTTTELYNSINNIFCNKFTKSYFEGLIGKLNQTGEIQAINQDKPKRFDLSSTTRYRLDEIKQRSIIAEKSLISEYHEIIQQYNLDLNIEEISKFIINMFNENYEVDVDEISQKSNNRRIQLKKIYADLLAYINKKAQVEEDVAKEIAQKLIDVSNKNTSINKSSISKMFINLFQDDKLEDYLNRAERTLYLDTQILLQIICTSYKGISNPDILYNIVKDFSVAIDNSNVPISLHTTDGYIEEVVAHLRNALKLEQFLDLPYIKSLGRSKNVFFNFYLSLRDIEEYESFTDFIVQLLDIEADDVINNFDYAVTNSLRYIFESLNIDIEPTPYIEPDEYQKYKREYEKILTFNNLDQKSYEARKNDLKTILYIAKEFVSNTPIPPYLITWDSSFYTVRDELKKFREIKYWHIYSPQKFTNTLSILNFKIDPTSVNNNIISLVEENFNLSNSTISFLDVLNNLFDKKDLSKWELAQKFASLRKEQEKDDAQKDRIEFNNLPIDEILLLILNNYQKNGASKDLIELFQNNEYADKIIDIIRSYINSFKTINNQLKPEIISRLNALIEENKKNDQNF